MTSISVLIQHHAGPTGNVLICRNADGAWELPHGTLRTNETEENAARRIAWEQVGIEVTPGKLVTIGHKYPKDGYTEHILCGNITHNTHTKHNYHCYYESVSKWQTEPVAGSYTEFRWVHPTELGGYEFDGDDKNFIAKYDPWVNAREIKDVRMF